MRKTATQKWIFSLATFSLIAVCVNGNCAEDQTGVNQNNHPNNSQYTGTVTPQDEIILNTIKELAKEPGYVNSDLKVNVTNGVVTIGGRIDTDETLKKLEKELKEIEGVKSVIVNADIYDKKAAISLSEADLNSRKNRPSDFWISNNTESSTGQHGQMNDQQLKNNIIKALTHNWISKNYPHVNISVSGGIVTLSGYTDSLSNKNALEARLNNIPGIKGVHNNVEVRASHSSSSSMSH